MSLYMKELNGYEYYIQKKNAFKRDHPKCARCGRLTKQKKRTLDHVIPMSLYALSGNALDQSNWQMLCRACHQIKTSKEDSVYASNTLRYQFAHAKSLR